MVSIKFGFPIACSILSPPSACYFLGSHELQFRRIKIYHVIHHLITSSAFARIWGWNWASQSGNKHFGFGLAPPERSRLRFRHLELICVNKNIKEDVSLHRLRPVSQSLVSFVNIWAEIFIRRNQIIFRYPWKLNEAAGKAEESN